MEFEVSATRVWSALRSRFNHDWLKNQYLLALSNWIDLLERDESQRRDVEFEQSFLTETLPQWKRRRPQAVEIMRGAAEVLSPRRLFDHAPLNRCPADLAGPLAELAHRFWLARRQVSEAVVLVDSAIAEVDEAFADVTRQLAERGECNRETARPLRPRFARLRDACRRLGDALERLAHVNERE